MNRILLIIFILSSINLKAQTQPRLVLPVGHTSALSSAVFSHDNKFVLTGAQDKLAHLWDVESGKLIQTFKSHNGYVTNIAFSNDDRNIITVGQFDSIVHIWDIKSGELLGTLMGHSDRILSVAYSPDNKFILTSSSDKTVRLWTSNTGILIHTLIGHKDIVRSANFNSTGSLILSTSDDSTACLWETSSGNLINTLVGHKSFLRSAKFSSDDAYIITVGDTTGRVWETSSGKLLHVLQGHKNVEKTYLGIRVIDSTSAGIKIKVDSNTPAELMGLKDNDLIKEINGKPYSPNKNLIPSFKKGDLIEIILNRNDTIKKIKGKLGSKIIETGWVYSGVFKPDGKHILTASADNTARVWDSKSGELLFTLNGHENDVNTAIYNFDGSLILTASEDGTASIWQADSGKLIQ